MFEIGEWQIDVIFSEHDNGWYSEVFGPNGATVFQSDIYDNDRGPKLDAKAWVRERIKQDHSKPERKVRR